VEGFENAESLSISLDPSPPRTHLLLPPEYNGIKEVAIKHIANKGVKKTAVRTFALPVR
jgi:hypothetical protein